MDFTATQSIAAPRQVVWDVLFDPAVLRACLPGCESIKRCEKNQFAIVVAAVVGPPRARFRGSLRIVDATPPHACKMKFEGQGGAVGFSKGSATVTLAEAAGGSTELSYVARADVGGKLAQIGPCLVDSVARKMADDFFSAFRARMDAVAPAAEASPPTTPAIMATTAPTSPAAQVSAARPPATMPVSPISVPAAPVHAAAAAPASALVPGWWLAVAAVLGAAVTALGNLIVS